MRALAVGESFIPTPVGGKSPVVTRKQDTPPPPPTVAPPRVAPVQTPRTDNTLLKRMMEDLATLDARLASVSVGEGKIVFVSDFSKDEPPATPAAVTTSANVPSTPAVALKPGDLLYAVIDTGVNSDVPSAVMGTVASGAFKNGRLLGKFQRFEERLVLSFSRIILPDGSNVQIEGYAVDPATSEASVASSVNTHFFSRWGGLIAPHFWRDFPAPKNTVAHKARFMAATTARAQIKWCGIPTAQRIRLGLLLGRSGKNWGAFLKKTLIALPPYTLKAEQPLAFSF